jgi:hypothetical protein
MLLDYVLHFKRTVAQCYEHLAEAILDIYYLFTYMY